MIKYFYIYFFRSSTENVSLGEPVGAGATTTLEAELKKVEEEWPINREVPVPAPPSPPPETGDSET